jgi:hypothetical protein
MKQWPNSSAEVCDGSIENGGGGDRCNFSCLGDRLFSLGPTSRFAGDDGARADRFGPLPEIGVSDG